jgi:serine/threonine protein kinase/WD40 repeat protein
MIVDTPETIGDYRLLREIGRGGMGIVYEAEQISLGRRVALKLLPLAGALSSKQLQRFRNEARAAATLHHPHIVPVHEFGVENGVYFYVMQLIEGESLAELLAERRRQTDLDTLMEASGASVLSTSTAVPGESTLSPSGIGAAQREGQRASHGKKAPHAVADFARVATWGIEAAQALDCAHQMGVVHRDIKPSNLLVDAQGKLWIADFGLAMTETDADLTQTGEVPGTLRYMSPEQARSDRRGLDHRTDIYSLGATLYELLTLEPPHASHDRVELLQHISSGDITPLRQRNRTIPVDLESIVLKALEGDPQRRYQRAEEMADDLARFLRHEPTLARPVSLVRRVGLAVVRHPVRSLLVVGALGAASLGFWGARESQQRQTVQAVVARTEAATELRRGFESWRTGNASAALEHLRACRTSDPLLADSFGGRWLVARLHGQRETLLATGKPAAEHPDLYCFSFSADGRVLAAGGADGRLFIQRLTEAGAAEGPPLAVQAHDEINDVAFSPDGLAVASVGEDGRVCLWKTADGSLLREALRAAEPLFAAAFSPSGEILACGGARQSLQLIPLTEADATARDLQPFAAAVAAGDLAADADVESIQFVSSGEMAVACGKLAAIIDLEGQILRTFAGHEGTVGQIALSSDGRRLLSGGTDREPRVWEMATGRLLAVLPRHPGWIQGCGFSPDGTQIGTGCRDGVVRVFDAGTLELERKIVGHVGRTWDVKYDSAGMVVSAGADGTLRRWDPRQRADVQGMREVMIPGRLPNILRRRFSLGTVASTDGTFTAVVQCMGRRMAVDLITGDVAKMAASPATRIAVDGPRKRLAVACERRAIEVLQLPWELRRESSADEGAVGSIRSLAGSEIHVTALEWSPAGMLFAGGVQGSVGGSLRAWDPTLEAATEIERFPTSVDAVRVSPAGPPRLAVASGTLVRIYPIPLSGPPQAVRGQSVVALPVSGGGIIQLAWSPDGRQVAFGRNNGRVEVVDAATGAPLQTFSRHAGEVVGLVWSDDGRTLISADPECLRFSDVATTMILDEVRPGWAIEDIDHVHRASSGVGPLVVLVGSAVTGAGEAEREARVGILDLGQAQSGAGGSP